MNEAMVFASLLSVLAIIPQTRPWRRIRPGGCQRTGGRPPRRASPMRAARGLEADQGVLFASRSRRPVVALPVVGQPHARAAGQAVDVQMVQRDVDADDRHLLGGLVDVHALGPRSWMRARGIPGASTVRDEEEGRRRHSRKLVVMGIMPPDPSVVRRPAADLGRKPTAALDWRRKSGRARRWRNRFAIWIPDPAFDRSGALSRRIGTKCELWIKSGITCGCFLHLPRIPVDN